MVVERYRKHIYLRSGLVAHGNFRRSLVLTENTDMKTMAETLQTAQVAKEMAECCQKIKGQEEGRRPLEEELSGKTGTRQGAQIGKWPKWHLETFICSTRKWCCFKHTEENKTLTGDSDQ